MEDASPDACQAWKRLANRRLASSVFSKYDLMSETFHRINNMAKLENHTPTRRLFALCGWMGCAVMGLSSLAAAGPTEVRGTWLTTTGPDHIASGLNTETITNQLRDVGVNTVYVEAWKNGFTNFPSATLDALIGQDRAPGLGQRDLLHETLVGAHRNNMIHMAWFEYGFSSQFVGNGGQPNNALSQYMIDQGWLLQDQQGRYGNASNGFAWMNPAVPEVRRLLVDLTVEAVQNYDVDGIQFDDRLAWPREFGWDATTATLYQAETGNSLPSSVDDAAFRNWRQGKVALFADELYTALKIADPHIFVSVSPSVTGFSDTQYNAVWTDWLADGLFDEFVPQVYRTNLGSFQSTLPANVAPFANTNRLDDLVVGIRFNGTGADTPLNDVQQMIVTSALTENGQLSGHSLFYSKGLIDNQTAMANFYGDDLLGPAPHPVFGLEHRPDPLVANVDSLNSNLWQVQVDEDGPYRVAVKRNGRWQETDIRYFESGVHELVELGADAVELLLSRRLPAVIDGDFNHDGTYNCSDVDALGNAIAGGLDPVAFDLTGDGHVDAADLEQWLLVAGNASLPSGGSFLPGDGNLDGTVDGQDFLIWNDHKFTLLPEFCSGDFNADGTVDGQDFVLWNNHKFTSADQTIPEPHFTLWWLGCLFIKRPRCCRREAGRFA